MAITQRGEDAIQASGDKHAFSPSADEHPPFETEESGDFDDGSARNPGIDYPAKGSTPLVKVVQVVAMNSQFCQSLVWPSEASDRFEANLTEAAPINFFHFCVGVVAFEITSRGFRIPGDVKEEGKELFALDKVDAVAFLVGKTKCFCDVVSFFADI